MAFVLKHTFTSAKPDEVDTTQIKPLNWGAAHSEAVENCTMIYPLVKDLSAYRVVER